MKPLSFVVAATVLIVFAMRATPAQQSATLEDSLKKSRVNGKYSMLLRQIKVPEDADTYTDFNDYGMFTGTAWAGHTDLPPGHWVYVAPYWYIWRDVAGTPKANRGWGPEQATGEPDTAEAGDFSTAWASASPDGQDEWLMLEYAEPVTPQAVLIHESYSPGAVNKVCAFRLDGKEEVVWTGTDPTRPDSDRGISNIVLNADFKTNRVKIYLNSREIPDWNEIDAVGLRDTSGKIQWAIAAEASSTFAQPGTAFPIFDGFVTQSGKRAWGPEQVLGEPDTAGAGDIQTAWASLSPDGQDEWLMLEYAEAAVPQAILVYETYNPGALSRVTVFKDEKEEEVWKGKDPTPVGSEKGVSTIPVKVDFKTKRVKIYLNSREVEGWNEIDAVGMRDTSGKTQWATRAEASSTYAQQIVRPAMPVMMPQQTEQRLNRLEAEVRQLKMAIEELKAAVEKSKKKD